MTFREQGLAARQASHELATLSRAAKDRALHAMADALLETAPQLLTANASDVARAQSSVEQAMVDRLKLTRARIEDMAAGLRDLAALPDPIGDVVRGWKLPNGIRITQVRVPLGVLGIIYEARPNVTADAAGIAVKSGNAVLLRGSSSAIASNRVIVEALRQGLTTAGLSPEIVHLVEGDREVTTEMMTARGIIDVLIPRGGAGLINAVVEGSSVPVIETGTGNCHVFVDAAANQAMALDILLNAKTQRPSVCNAAETLLVHSAIADEFIPKALQALHAAGVTVHGGDDVQRYSSSVVATTKTEFDTEYLALDIAVKLVDSVAEAVKHIRAHSTGHSETIISESREAIATFTEAIDAAAVLVNTSSRFVDGGQFGFGAEIGISTQKLHARGPMALPEMTTTKYIVEGSGQIRP